MKRIDKFILTAFTGPFFLILLVVIFILVMQFLWVYIDELVGKGLSVGIVAEFLFWASCTVLPLALPLATLLSSMMTIGQMGENNELIALKAAGVSILRIMAPILIASVFISIGTFFIINDLVPEAYNQIFTLRDDIKRTKNEIKIPSGTFYDGVEGYMLRVEGHDPGSGMMRGVMLYDHVAGKGNTRLTLADSAIMKMSKDKSYITFSMFNGANYQETNTKTYRDTTLQLQKIDFRKQEMVIALENYAFKKSDSARFGDQVRALPLKDLNIGRDSLKRVRDSISRSQVESIAAALNFQLRQQLDSNASGITRNFSAPGYLTWPNKALQAAACRRAADNAQQLGSTLISYELGSYDYTVLLRWTDLEYLRRFAQALACLVMFFIGAPLGALIRKGGLGTSAIVSLLFFVLYWIVDITGVKLAHDGAVSGVFGAFISSLVLFPIGIFLTWKAIHDSDIFNTDSLKSAWRKLKSRIGGLFRKTRIVYMGTPEFAVEPLKALLDHKFKVVGVVTVADKPSGRGRKVTESAVKQFAVEHGLPVLQPERLKDPAFLQALKAWKADLFVVVAFRMLPREVWGMPKLGTFNLHAALLPQYRGAAPINWAVINGEQRTGVTTFMIDKDIDTGGIILRHSIRIADTDTAGDVHDKLMAVGADLVVQTADGLIQHNVETRVQRSFVQGSEVLKPAPKLTRELCHIDWNDTTRDIHNLVRGLSPYPAAFTELVALPAAEAPEQPDASPAISRGSENAITLKIYACEKLEGTALQDLSQGRSLKPGTILTDGKTRFAITTLDGALSLQEVQLAGKKRMDIQSFLLGFRNPAGYATTPGTSRAEIEKTRS